MSGSDNNFRDTFLGTQIVFPILSLTCHQNISLSDTIMTSIVDPGDLVVSDCARDTIRDTIKDTIRDKAGRHNLFVSPKV